MPVVVAERSAVPQAFLYDTGYAPLIASIWNVIANDVVRLFKNDFYPDFTTAVGDLVEAENASYAPIALPGAGTMQANSDGSVTVLCDTPLEWQGPGDDTGETIYGYYITNSGGDSLKAAYRFPVPVGLNLPTDVLTLLPGLTFPPIG